MIYMYIVYRKTISYHVGHRLLRNGCIYNMQRRKITLGNELHESNQATAKAALNVHKIGASQ